MAIWLFERVKCSPLYFSALKRLEIIFVQSLKWFTADVGAEGGHWRWVKITPAAEQLAFVHLQTLRLAPASSGLTSALRNAEKPKESEWGHYLTGRDCAFHLQTTSFFYPPHPRTPTPHCHCHYSVYSCGDMKYVMKLESTERARQ